MDPMFFFTNWKARESVLGFDGFLSEEVCDCFTWNFLKKQRICCRAFFEARGWRELKHFKSWGLRLLLQISSSTIFWGGMLPGDVSNHPDTLKEILSNLPWTEDACFQILGSQDLNFVDWSSLLDVRVCFFCEWCCHGGFTSTDFPANNAFEPKKPRISHLTNRWLEEDLASFFWGAKVPWKMGESHCQF